MTSYELASTLGRTPLWVSGIQKRLSLPLLSDYPPSYVAFLRKIRDLENLSVSRDKIERLWELERSLIRLLHLISGEDFLQIIAGCSAEADPDRRLLLSNADLGVPLLARDLQPGLDFMPSAPRELFGGREMGEDAVRLLGEYRTLLGEIRKTVSSERLVLKATLRWEKSVGLGG
jgi:hypothetical protein